MKHIILIALFFKVILLSSCINPAREKAVNEHEFLLCHFDSMANILQSLGICLNVNAEKWEDTIKANPNIESEWRYFYDTNFFKSYKVCNELSCQNLFLLEVSINHGSGEYDNYMIRKGKSGYEIVSDFKGYLNKITFTEGKQFRFTYRISITNDKSCLVDGIFNGVQMVTDTVLSNDEICKRVFKKGKPF